MNRDIICLIALKLDVKRIRNLLTVNKRFYEILNNEKFVYRKINSEFPAMKNEYKNLRFYIEMKNQLAKYPNNLPIIKCPNNYMILHEMFRNNVYKDICKNNELIYGICNDYKTFENLFEIFYSYISGGFSKPSDLSWPEYYMYIINNVNILKTGFKIDL